MAIARQPFGRTGHLSSRVIFGAAALGRASQAAADRALDELLAHGVNHIDTARAYGDAELRLRPWLAAHPGEFFLATKSGARDARHAREELHQSLERLGVDHVDLWQIHNLADPIEWDTALSPGGILDAAVEARDQGLVRFIGVTGHGSQMPAMHLRSLSRFDFDSVLLPFNYLTMQDAHYAARFEKLAAVCQERDIAMQTIKSLALAPWSGRDHTATTWYEPLHAQADIDLSVWWGLGRDGIFLNSTGDLDILPRFLDAAERFESRPPEVAMEELVQRSGMQPLFV